MLMAGLRSGVADPAMAKAQALMSLAAQVRREAYVSAYSDAFRIVGVGLIISLSAIALLKRPRRTASIEVHKGHWRH
jgi:MFS transporter, DHA2 family, multidrug resistance protein